MRIHRVAVHIETGRNFLFDVGEYRMLYLFREQIERQQDAWQIAAAPGGQRSLVEILIAQHR
jgi:hypothetical protein